MSRSEQKQEPQKENSILRLLCILVINGWMFLAPVILIVGYWLDSSFPTSLLGMITWAFLAAAVAERLITYYYSYCKTITKENIEHYVEVIYSTRASYFLNTGYLAKIEKKGIRRRLASRIEHDEL